MALTVGTRLGHYDVTALLGEGGMGQVWQASDTKLNREVALKILPDAFAADPDRLARFTREAQILASLNHPNIAAIHGIEEAEGTRALVLELVEGPTLADRISKGPIPLDEALPIAKQIAEALEAAHEAGVIHRDLKPANIKVREDGTVKVLDFGLAKAFDPAPDADPSQSPTLTAAATQMGVIMGTAAYMSPEQARGKPVDKRADIWSFGVVLYEMLTGQRAFQGEDVSLTLASVMKSDVKVTTLPPDLPANVRTVLRRCLEKDATQRIRDIGDVRLALEGAFETTIAPSERVVASQLQLWQRPATASVAVVLLVLVTSVFVWTLTRADVIPPPDLMRFTIVPPEDAPLGSGGSRQDIAISPDGTQIVYGGRGPDGRRQLYLRPIDQLVGTPLRGAENGGGPFISPDGAWVGFQTTGSNLLKVPIFGGPSQTLVENDSPIAGASWGADDQIIWGGTAGLLRVSAGGGESEAPTTLDAERGDYLHAWPFIIPARGAVLFTIGTGSMLVTGQLAVLDLDSREVTELGLTGFSPRYVSTGHLVYADADGAIRAVGFDVTSLEVTGNPVPLVEGVMMKNRGAANFSISGNGRLVFATGAEGTGSHTLVWVYRDGHEEPLSEFPPADYRSVAVSPDGDALALEIVDDAGIDIWVYDLARGTRNPLTTDPADDRTPIWTPDGVQMESRSSSRRREPGPSSCTGEMPTAPGLWSVSLRRVTHQSWSKIHGLRTAMRWLS